MKIPILAVAIAILGTPATMLGQQVTAADRDPAVVNSASVTVKLENDSVRVMEAVMPPGFKEKLHTHPGYVMYILEGGNVRIHMTDGSTRDAELKAGNVFYSEPVTHWAENTGTTTIRIVLVELRRKQIK